MRRGMVEIEEKPETVPLTLNDEGMKRSSNEDVVT
jgi:hypothetical protein